MDQRSEGAAGTDAGANPDPPDPLPATGGGAAPAAVPGDAVELQERVARIESGLAEARLRGVDAEAMCEMLTHVLEAVSDAFVALDSDWRYTFVNAQAGRLFGREPASLIGKHIWTEFPEGVGQPFHRAYERAVAEQVPLEIEEYYPPYDRWFENRIYPFAGGLAIFFHDVTDRKLAELKLRESEARFRAIVEQSIVGVYKIRDGRYTYVNPCLAEMLGYEAEELCALPSVLDVVHPDDRGWVAERLARRVAGEVPPPSRFRAVRKDGRVIHVEAHGRRVPVNGGDAVIGVQMEVTDQARVAEELGQSEARFRSMIENASDAITIVDAHGIVLFATPSFERVFGIRAESRRGRSAFEGIHPEDVGAVVAAFRGLLAAPGSSTQAEFRAAHGDGTWRHVAAVAQNRLDDPAVQGVVVNARDITGRVRAEQALRESEERFRTLVEQSPESIVLHADGRVLYANPASAALIGVADARELVGKSVLDFVQADDRAPALERLEALMRGDPVDAPTSYRLVRHDDGRVIDVEVTSAATTYGGRPAVQSHVHDVTTRVAMEAQLIHQAFHDPLTGLANRVLFRDRAEHALARTVRGEHLAVVLLDLDDFKRVNDSLGHAAGDELLKAVAHRLLDAARASDTVARLGGDEFALLLEGLAHDDDVGAVLERVTATLRPPVTVGAMEVAVSASLGVALPLDGEGAEELLRNADVAMYRAKAHGKGRFEIFAPEMHAAAMDRLELEADLRAALSRDEFQLVFQPLVDLVTERIVGAEALVRWQHPTRGLLRPAAFIPVAEQTGLIVPLGRWVLDEACRQAHAWEHPADAGGAAAYPAPWVSVNISGRQLQEPTFALEVATALSRSALPPSRLVLEITESVLLHDAEASLAKLDEIKDLGIRLALDDFGTGFSSLAYLHRFPIDVLKMDKSFTEGLGREAGEPALPRAIVGLGRSLGMQTVAEGIEGAAQFGRLRQLGCDIGQGYLFAEPTGALEFAALLGSGGSGAPA